MGSTKLDTLVGKSATSGNRLAVTPSDIPTTPIRKALEDLSVLHNHQALVQVLEEIRQSTGQNFGGADGVTNGTTAVEMVAAPDSGFLRRVESILVYNVDSATAVILLQKDNGSSERIFHRKSLGTLVSDIFNDSVVLTSVESLEIKLEGAVTTTELDWVVSWRDYESI